MIDRFLSWLDRLGQLGDAMRAVPPDNRKRRVIHCKCPTCGFTQLVSTDPTSKHGRWCACCGDAWVSALEDWTTPSEELIK